VLHELWVDAEGQTFVLAGPHGDDARANLPVDAILTWTVEAGSHFEAMTLYYEHMGWGEYTTEFPVDEQTYAERGWE
jgi:hypothetical protein